MSLPVDVLALGPNGDRRVLDVPEGYSDLAGFERWRTAVWGSEVVRSLGARFLPALADAGLWVEPDQVPAFLRECALLRENLGRIAAGTRPERTVGEHREQFSVRSAHIEDAAGRARALGGGVVIW
ncbi:hypothetical protein [Nocardiopsis lucentensis]|uniref:hypothetical protein n=1 Tax=Nocardiopsis lucentensis TaxID=53441 RepID=UPI000476AB94|nr:hypothetical protein [Nocardiopsis lucentensis]